MHGFYYNSDQNTGYHGGTVKQRNLLRTRGQHRAVKKTPPLIFQHTQTCHFSLGGAYETDSET